MERPRHRIDRERAGAAALSAVVTVLLGYALVAGLAVSLPVKPAEVAALFTIAVPPPPPPPDPPPPPHPRLAAREGASAPPNIKSRATEVQAPEPVVPPIQPPPIATAPLPSVGSDATSGAALTAGPGTGAGGTGNGTGNGRYGNGPGGGGTPAEQLNDLRPRDLPADARDVVRASTGALVVTFRLTVNPAGRVVGCTVLRTSGSSIVDAGTCQAAFARLRFRPERDAAGRAIPVTFVGDQRWEFVNREPPSGRSLDD